MTTADAVADHLIALAHQRGEPINDMQLQKLLYYAQAWHLALYDEPLFPEKFQAWSTGPVIPDLYWRNDQHGNQPLPLPCAVPELPARTLEFLDELSGRYFGLSMWDLHFMVVREKPYLNARAGVDLHEPCTAEIDEGDMRSYFRELAEAA
ncbi:MAG TPA: type II toxin-antitoxin system antitoxin SocA domain-containing protein [Longimicrobiaceae bacterium]